MAIMLLPDEIPRYWEAIKFAAINAEIIEEQYRERYLNRLLYLLLAGKAQCFVRLSTDRQLEMIGLTSIEVDPIRDEKTLFAYSLYSFKRVGDQVWFNDLDALVEWAKASKCNTITFWSNNQKAIELASKLNIKKRLEMFILDVSGGV